MTSHLGPDPKVPTRSFLNVLKVEIDTWMYVGAELVFSNNGTQNVL
jgi:hypothetical protein